MNLLSQKKKPRVINPSGHMAIFKKKVLLFIGEILMFYKAQGLGFEVFTAEYRRPMEEYVMTGYGDGWRHCDTLSANKQEANIDEDIPNFSITLDRLSTIDLRSILSYSRCVLAIYEVDTIEHLASIIKFGWKAIRNKRIALILKLGSGLTMDNPINRTKLPFPVAAELENGVEQFICPFIGEDVPILQGQMCNNSYLSLERKTVRIGVTGHDLVGKSLIIY